jgi:hypothetical protein
MVDMLVRMAERLPTVTLREVAGDAEELAALQRVMESDEDYALRSPATPRARPTPRAP